MSNRKVIKSQHIKYVDQVQKISPEFQRIPLTSANGVSGRQGTANGRETETLRLQWEEMLHKAERESFSRGFSEGMQQGRELEKKEALLALRACGDLLRETAALKSGILQNVEREILQLAFSIARKVLHQEVTVRRDVVQGVLKSAIKNIVDREDITVRLHPEDFHYMMEIKPDFLSNFDGIKNIIFEEDTSIRRGGAVLETRFGEVDARLEQQLQEVERVLTAP